MRKKGPANPFSHTCANKRYRTIDYMYKQRFSCKVVKASLDAGLSCPNRDGTKGFGGCLFCSNKRSGDFCADSRRDIQTQLALQKKLLSKKWPHVRCIAYFQAGSNTYAPLDTLKRMAEEALSVQDVVGICFATRADCLSEEVCAWLRALSRRTYVEVELGLQSVFDETAARMHRMHTYREFLAGYTLLQRCAIPVCVHLLFSLPGESRAMMLESVRCVSVLRPFAVKFHMLYIQSDAPLAKAYAAGAFSLLDKDAYVQLVCDAIERLHPSIAVARVTGDGNASRLVAPLWIRDKRSVLNAIDRELSLRESCQGVHCAPDGSCFPSLY